MLNNYSWSGYFTTMAILILIYYIAVIAIFYKQELQALLSGNYGLSKQREVDENEAIEDADSFSALEAAVSDLKRNVFQQAGKEPNRTELLMKLRYRLGDYGGMQTPAYRVAVNHFIIQQAKEICGVAYSEQELEAEWEKLPRNHD